MAVEYHIYRNDGLGGPVDYSSAIATVNGLSYATAPIPAGSDVRFAVRAFDTVSGLEDRNTDAAVRIVTDGAGIDRTGTPASPTGLTATATAGGTAKVEWGQPPSTRENAPSTFNVWMTASPGPINHAATPDATTPFVGAGNYHATLTGLADGVSYLVAVRAVNANGSDGNVATVVVVGSTVGPDAVQELTGGLT